MVKQTKTFKKGNVTKKALSAILAASMVMTSSSFVMAAPVEVEDVAVEAAAVAEDAAVADVVEDVDAGEESVGASVTLKDITVDTVTPEPYTGKEIKPALTVKAVKVTDGTVGSEETLTPEVDYTVEYTNNTDAGTASYTVKFDQNTYPGVANVYGTFEIEKNTSVQTSDVTVKWDYSDGMAYNGDAQYPKVKEAFIMLNGVKIPLTADDYTVKAQESSHAGTYIDAVDAGKYNAVLKDIGNDNLSVSGVVVDTKEYEINKIDFNDIALKVETKTLTTPVSDTKVKAAVTVKLGDKVVPDTEYEVSYIDPFDEDNIAATPFLTDKAGTYKIQLTPTASAENFVEGGKIITSYKAEGDSFQKKVEAATVTGATKNSETGLWEAEYSRDEQEFTINTITGLTLTGTGTNAKVESVKGTELGTYQIVVTGLREYAGETATVDVKIVPKKLTKDNTTNTAGNGYMVTATRGITKDGKPSSEVMVSIKDEDATTTAGKDVFLENGKDYTYTVDTKKKQVIITGIGNYTTKVDKDTTVAIAFKDNSSIDLAESKITASVSGTYAYTGAEVCPQGTAVAVYDNTGAEQYKLVQDTDYTLSYEDNTNAGEATVVINGTGNYSGEKRVTFKIDGIDFASTFELRAMKNIKKDDIVGTNNPQNVQVVFKETQAYAGSTYYAVKYLQNGKEITDWSQVKAGTVDVEVTGKGRYVGKLTTSYQIIGEDISKSIKIGDIDDQAYTGNAIEPKLKLTTGTLIEGKDYKVTYENNVKVGVAHVTIEGIGEYSGKVVKAFNIVGEMDQTIEVLAAQERDLGNGTRTLNSKATKIKYTTAPETAVTYTSSDENVVTVDAEGNLKYTGLGEATITIEAKAENGYKAVKKEIKVVVKLAKPSFTPFSKNNAFTLTSSTVKGAEKFEVQYATKKNFSNAKTKTFTTTTAGKIRQVKVAAADKTTYYVRVRAVSGTTKSAWSGVKTVATK